MTTSTLFVIAVLSVIAILAVGGVAAYKIGQMKKALAEANARENSQNTLAGKRLEALKELQEKLEEKEAFVESAIRQILSNRLL